NRRCPVADGMFVRLDGLGGVASLAASTERAKRRECRQAGVIEEGAKNGDLAGVCSTSWRDWEVVSRRVHAGRRGVSRHRWRWYLARLEYIELGATLAVRSPPPLWRQLSTLHVDLAGRPTPRRARRCGGWEETG